MGDLMNQLKELAKGASPSNHSSAQLMVGSEAHQTTFSAPQDVTMGGFSATVPAQELPTQNKTENYVGLGSDQSTDSASRYDGNGPSLVGQSRAHITISAVTNHDEMPAVTQDRSAFSSPGGRISVSFGTSSRDLQPFAAGIRGAFTDQNAPGVTGIPKGRSAISGILSHLGIHNPDAFSLPSFTQFRDGGMKTGMEVAKGKSAHPMSLSHRDHRADSRVSEPQHQLKSSLHGESGIGEAVGEGDSSDEGLCSPSRSVSPSNPFITNDSNPHASANYQGNSRLPPFGRTQAGQAGIEAADEFLCNLELPLGSGSRQFRGYPGSGLSHNYMQDLETQGDLADRRQSVLTRSMSPEYDGGLTIRHYSGTVLNSSETVGAETEMVHELLMMAKKIGLRPVLDIIESGESKYSASLELDGVKVSVSGPFRRAAAAKAAACQQGLYLLRPKMPDDSRMARDLASLGQSGVMAHSGLQLADRAPPTQPPVKLPSVNYIGKKWLNAIRIPEELPISKEGSGEASYIDILDRKSTLPHKIVITILTSRF